jgi:maltooligosyltrehalose trehalohydrolase
VLAPGQGGYYADFGTMAQLKKAMEETFVYDGAYSKYRRRVHGKSAAHLSQHRFLGFIQNHDQIGNGAVGDRLHHCAGLARAKVAAALVLTSPFVPMIFQGEEWAASSPFQYFADHDDPEMARMISEGRKREFAAFGWDPKDVPDPEKKETFQRSKLNWDETGQGEHAQMLAWYRELIRLRRLMPELNFAEPGNTRVVCSEEGKWLEMRRGPVRVLCNLSDEERWFHVPQGARVLLNSAGDVAVREGSVCVEPDAAVILRS